MSVGYYISRCRLAVVIAKYSRISLLPSTAFSAHSFPSRIQCSTQ